MAVSAAIAVAMVVEMVDSVATAAGLFSFYSSAVVVLVAAIAVAITVDVDATMVVDAVDTANQFCTFINASNEKLLETATFYYRFLFLLKQG